jgi:hypothetical protein
LVLEHGDDRVGRTELTRGIEQCRTNEVNGHHSEELLLLLGALGFDSAGLAAAGFELDAPASEDGDFASDDLFSLGFDSLPDCEPLEELESLPPDPPSEEPEEAAAPSPFDSDLRAAFWSFLPSLP